MVTLVGITGIARAGKDTLADCLASKPYDKKVSLAEPIKLGIATMLDIPLVWTNTDGVKDSTVPGFNFTLRKAMQTLGTEWGRALDENVWVDIAHKKLKAHREWMLTLDVDDSVVVIPDIRFNNEAEWIRGEGGVVVKVDRAVNKPVQQHSSEVGVSNRYIDLIIQNNGTKEVFMYRAKELRNMLVKQGGK